MKTTIVNRPRRAPGQVCPALRVSGTALLSAMLLLAPTNLRAQAPNGVVVATLDGGGASPFYGYREGNAVSSVDAQYHTPVGLAMDSTGNYLWVADRDNNAIRVVNLSSAHPAHCNSTYTFLPIPGITPAGTIASPVGVALDAEDNLYVLNRGNGANGTVLEFDYEDDGYAFTTLASGLANANGFTLDSSANIYVTVNNTNVIKISSAGVKTTLAAITNAGTILQGICVMSDGNLAVCDSGRNGILRITPTGGVSTNTGFNGAGDNNFLNNGGVPKGYALFNQPYGIAAAAGGLLVVSDYGNNRVKVVNSAGAVTNLYGVSSSLWYTGPNSWPGWADGNVVVPDAYGDVEARLPNGVLLAPNGTVYVTEDYYHLIRQVTSTTPLFPPPAPPPSPTGVTASTSCGQVSLTWSASSGATNYNVKRSTTSGGPYTNNTIASTSATSYTDTNLLSGTNYYYVVSAVGNGLESQNSAEVSATPSLPPAPSNLSASSNYGQVALTWLPVPCTTVTYNVKRTTTSTNGPYTTIANTASTSYTDTTATPGMTYYYVVSALYPGNQNLQGPDSTPPVTVTPPCPPGLTPQIGYVDFPAPAYTSVFHPVSYYPAYNDTPIVIEGTNIYYTYGYTTNANDVLDPTPTSPSMTGYPGDGYTNVTAYTIPVQLQSNLTVKAIGGGGCGPSSAPWTAIFQFITANPGINGDNAAQFTISDITTNAYLYYTLDTSDPSPANTNAHVLDPGAAPAGVWTVWFPIYTNTLFKVRAFRDNYQPSAIESQWFYPSNVLANTISFGFAPPQEGSSAFIGAPGQTFYAPVTLSVLPATMMYSLQFNLTVTNCGAAPKISQGDYGFVSMLMKPVVPIPTNYPSGFALYTNIPPNLEALDDPAYLLGVGWLERYAETNLYDTLSQDLIQYSEAHDVVHLQSQGSVIVGGYSFHIPPTAKPDDQYQILIGRPSATSDGVGAPGADVYIATPTNDAVGAVSARKYVTVGSQPYLVGDAYPFRWFNAGDFGDNYLDNADVEQVFESAIYHLNTPPNNSDFYNGMDSSGGLGEWDSANMYYTNTINSPLAGGSTLYTLFQADNYTDINQMIFGDGKLDVTDVYVTFCRSLDTNLTWYSRFWTNQMLVAVDPKPGAKSLAAMTQLKVSTAFLTNPPSVNFAATDVTTSAGKAVQIPITASIFGNYPLRLLMLNLSVVPLDGSPALTTPVQFSANPALGTNALTASTGNGNYAAAFLNNGIAGLTGNATVGTLTVTIPASAPSSAAYAIHFDHASASPNGLASFPAQTLTGLILLSDRSSSIFKDGIPDSWRLRYFGTVNNLLSQAAADADGDGASNWQEYIAGTDPTDPKSVLRVSTDQASAQQAQDCVIRWPSVAGKNYVIYRSTGIFGANWTPISTTTGTGAAMEFHDTTGGKVRFYRVNVTQ